MRRLQITLSGLAVAILASGFAGAETYPASAPVAETFEAEALRISRVPPVNPLRVTTSDVAWDGNGAVDIEFSMNQRAMVWVAIYETGSNETGATSLFGAVQRLQPQDKFVAIAPNPAGASPSKQATTRSGGTAMIGRATRSDRGVMNSTSSGSISSTRRPSWLRPTTGISTTPSSTCAPTRSGGYRRSDSTSNTGESPRNSIFSAQLGTDFLANPTAWETWDANNVYNELNNVEPNSRGGLYPDPSSDDIFFISESSWNENSGVIKMRANRAARAFEPVTDFGENGLGRYARTSGRTRMPCRSPYGTTCSFRRVGVRFRPTCRQAQFLGQGHRRAPQVLGPYQGVLLQNSPG